MDNCTDRITRLQSWSRVRVYVFDLFIYLQIDLPNWSQMFTLEKDTKASQEEVRHERFIDTTICRL